MNDVGEMTTTDMDTAAELMASYFELVHMTENTSVGLEVEQKSFNWDDTLIHFSPEVVKKQRQKLHEEQSPGPDGIHP